MFLRTEKRCQISDARYKTHDAFLEIGQMRSIFSAIFCGM